jgi:DNA-binding transcriptional ArsR family regulator
VKWQGNIVKLFVSWSGETSHKVALLLKERLPSFLPGIEPWVSSVDIAKGVRWSHEIAKQLDDCNFGIVCVDPSNLKSNWLNFEAGALSKSLDNGRVAPFLVGLIPSEVDGPLSQFQMTTVSVSDVRRLIESINQAMGDNKLPIETLRDTFSLFWPALRDDLSEIEIPAPQSYTPTSNATRHDNLAPASLDEGKAKEPDETDIAVLKALAGRIVGGHQQLVPVDVVVAGTGVSPASAEYHVRRLKEMGFIDFNPQGYPQLTPNGLDFLGNNKHL